MLDICYSLRTAEDICIISPISVMPIFSHIEMKNTTIYIKRENVKEERDREGDSDWRRGVRGEREGGERYLD